MKRLLMLFSAFVLGIGSSLTVVSCRPRVKEDNNRDGIDINRDLEHMNDIKREVKQHFNSWWEKNTAIHINAFRGQETSFNALVSMLEEKKERINFTWRRNSIALQKLRFYKNYK